MCLFCEPDGIGLGDQDAELLFHGFLRRRGRLKLDSHFSQSDDVLVAGLARCPPFVIGEGNSANARRSLAEESRHRGDAKPILDRLRESLIPVGRERADSGAELAQELPVRSEGSDDSFLLRRSVAQRAWFSSPAPIAVLSDALSRTPLAWRLGPTLAHVANLLFSRSSAGEA
jgi:hypothetical protein